MQTSAITPGNTVTAQRATSRGFNDLDGEDFFALLIAQLQGQDPLKPTDNQQLLNQMSSIRQMEQSAKLNSTLDSLASEQRFGAVSGLIGHYIAGTVQDSAGQPTEIQGLVIGVRFEAGRGILELHNGKSIPAESVEQVTLVENLPADILAQLQEELAQSGLGGTPDSGEEDDFVDRPDPLARLIASDKSKLDLSNMHAQQSTRKLGERSIIESLLNQGLTSLKNA